MKIKHKVINIIRLFHFVGNEDGIMRITKPDELIGKEVYDYQGTAVGVFDKYWRSWNKQDSRWFFGIRPYENVRDAWFRGTTKLIPIYSDYIKEIGETVTLKKVMTDLSNEWRKAISFGQTSWPTDDLMERGIYDKYGSRVGIFFAWAEENKKQAYYGCFVDPYLTEKWRYDYNTLMPLKTEYFYYVTDSITLNASIDDLKKYWDGFVFRKKPAGKVKSAKKTTKKPKAQTKKAKAKKKK